MIQAPQIQYMPMQQVMPMNYQQQGANQAVQYQQQTPGYYYNYPTSSCYTQPTAKSQFNGVNIEIINPQGQATAPQYGCQMPAQYMPIQQAPVMVPAYPQPFPASQAIVQAPQAAPVAQVPVQQTVAQPVVYDTPVATPQVTPQAAAPVVVPQPQIQASEAQQAQVQTVPEAQAAPQAAAPVVENAEAQAPTISPEAFAGRLQSTNLDEQKTAIEEIAEKVKNDKTAGPILLDTQIFDGLVGIINKDTSTLAGPTPEVQALREKAKQGGELTAEESKLASTPSELEKAEINKQYALYTIAYMQERLNNELEARNGQALALKDLPCIENVVETVKSNPNPMLRISAIASLSHVARPEYKADLSKVFELAKADEDPRVVENATKAIENLK